MFSNPHISGFEIFVIIPAEPTRKTTVIDLFETSYNHNPLAWGGMQDDFRLRILAGDGAQLGHGRTGAYAQVFSGQKKIVDGEGRYRWNWTGEPARNEFPIQIFAKSRAHQLPG